MNKFKRFTVVKVVEMHDKVVAKTEGSVAYEAAMVTDLAEYMTPLQAGRIVDDANSMRPWTERFTVMSATDLLSSMAESGRTV